MPQRCGAKFSVASIESTGEDNCVRRDLDVFRKYKEAVDGSAPAAESLDFEEFISFLDIEHYLGLRGSDTWSSEGNETQVAVKRYIGQVIWEATPSLKSIPPLYLEFARRLKGGDTVITFNYDTLLEASLDAVGQPYRRFRERYTETGTLSCTTDLRTHEVVLLKLHGSVDWFNSGQYAERVKVGEEFGHTVTEDPIFGPHRIVDTIPLVDGERLPLDPLKSIFRVPDPSALYTDNFPLIAPHILAPSYNKVVYVGALKDFWYELGRMGSLERGMAIIGFSLPAHDEYVRQVVYRLTRNYTQHNWPEVMPDRIKTRLRMVDLRTGEHPLAEFYARYRFIDWAKADASFDGFSEASLDFIFTSTPAKA